MLTYIFNKKSHIPLYEQLYHFIRNDILNGVIEGGSKLPSKRELASHLGISKVTVEAAYASLISEGYIYSIEKRGYYAENNLTIPASFNNTAFDDRVTESKYRIDLSANTVPTDKFPFSVWSRLMREVILNYSRELLEPLPYNGAFVLRQSIARYLLEERGMNVSPSRIIIGAGSEYLYGLIIRLLGTDKLYGIENPSYHKIRKVYDMNSVSYRLIDVSDDGVLLTDIIKSGVDIVHISPSHNFPTGKVMSTRARHKLINWANMSSDRYIIEDDFDSELRFSGKTIPPLQTLDTNGNVIYINTFSKTISPSFRIGYMVLPEKLAEKYKNELGFNSCTVPSFEQYTLSEFISQGYFERHLSRMKRYYRILRSQLFECFNNCELSKKCKLIDSDSGLHFTLLLDTDKTDEYFKSELLEMGIRVSFMSDYGGNAHLLLVNYSGLNIDDFNETLELIYKIQGE